MRDKYLLPCSCGERIPVETTMAGQNIQCSCGRTLEVPNMQGIRGLERSVETSGTSQRTSSRAGVALGIGLIGLIILVVGLSQIWWTYSRRPVLPELNYSPWDTWLMWQDLREGVRLPDYAEPPYMQAKKVYAMYMSVSVAVTTAGIVTIATGAIVALTGRRHRRRQALRRAP